MEDQPLVAIVIVNWNKKEYLSKLLGSLSNIEYKNHDIIVVDNASTDGSLELLRSSFPGVHIIANESNIGGAGGFNTGMRYALGKGVYEYVWLLDNDAEVTDSTLIELVGVMEGDGGVGIAGSMIVNPDDREHIVEVGLNIDWNTGIVKPFMENYALADVKEGVYEVDCVPACSALVRAEALRKTRLMDERYFIWWDDTDLSLSVGRAGYKIVGVTRSLVYHPTEKDWILVNYYNNRNSLLAFSKFADLKQRTRIFHRIASYSCKGILFHNLTGNKDLGGLLDHSLEDFFRGRWRRYAHDDSPPLENTAAGGGDALPDKKARVIILPTGNLAAIKDCVDSVKSAAGECSVTLLIQEYRKNLFEGLPIDDFIMYDDKKRNILLEHAGIFVKILSVNFDAALMPSRNTDSPFGYAAKKYYVYDEEMGAIRYKGKRRDLWKVFFASFAGELAAIPLTLLLLIKSSRYRDEQRESK